MYIPGMHLVYGDWLAGWLSCWLLCLFGELPHDTLTYLEHKCIHGSRSGCCWCGISLQREATIAACCFTIQGTLVGNKVYLFGGEDAARRPQGDLFVLDLADMEWQSPEVTGAHTSNTAESMQQHLTFS